MKKLGTLTIYFNLTYIVYNRIMIIFRVGNATKSLVVVDYILSMNRTGCCKHGRYSFKGEIVVFETQ